MKKVFTPLMQRIVEDTGHTPNLGLLPSLYHPDNSVVDMPSPEDEFDVFRIVLDNTLVRFKEGSYGIKAMVEGKLSTKKPRGPAAERVRKTGSARGKRVGDRGRLTTRRRNS